MDELLDPHQAGPLPPPQSPLESEGGPAHRKGGAASADLKRSLNPLIFLVFCLQPEGVQLLEGGVFGVPALSLKAAVEGMETPADLGPDDAKRVFRVEVQMARRGDREADRRVPPHPWRPLLRRPMTMAQGDGENGDKNKEPKSPARVLAFPLAGRTAISRRAQAVLAVTTGLLSRDEACRQYGMTEEELAACEETVKTHGWEALQDPGQPPNDGGLMK